MFSCTVTNGFDHFLSVEVSIELLKPRGSQALLSAFPLDSLGDSSLSA